MGTEELLAALRLEGEREAREIRDRGEASAQRLREEAQERLALVRQAHRRELEAQVRSELQRCDAAARRAARLILLKGYDGLARRLWDISVELLPALRDEGYPELFKRLAAELPQREWRMVRVNPQDADLAAGLFPDADIVADREISGGLVAVSPGEELQVINTLEKRLERGWPELLPMILKEVEVDADA
ncbi:V-type ATP synthase subunit E [Geomonas oryzae]|uniref:V-type ATP synthase subunit E n=1 Tax=Geomonas oryzae TaxID=2364273 RepID=UPI00100B80BB|nr:V-type ATP synthase subunit E [Geomonas oryzae]